MPFTDRDVAASGRSSRASELSGTRVPRSSQPIASDMFSAPGVLSMLKTSTDTGDIGALSFNKTRLPALPRPALAKRSTPSYMSEKSHRTSHSYAASQSSNKYSAPQQPWDTHSIGHRGSFTSLRTSKTMPPYLSDGPLPPPPAAHTREAYFYGPSPAPSQESRAYSVTQSSQHRGLTIQRSVSSLRSQGTAAPGPPPPGPPPRAVPYMYPPRFKRPGHRSVSPALSDLSGPSSLPQHGRHIHRPPLNSYYGDLAAGPPQTHSLQHYGHPPPRHAQMMPPHGQPMYSQPMNGLPMHPQSMYHQPMPGPPMKRGPANIPGHHYEPSHYAYRDPYRPSNAPHMARNVAPPYTSMTPRTFTPRMESVPSSSEPGSSAPPSSNPPTPREAATYDAIAEPVVVDTVICELPDESSVRMAYKQYANFVDAGDNAYELEAEPVAIHEVDTATKGSENQSFVQRMKMLLNQRTGAITPPFVAELPSRTPPPPPIHSVHPQVLQDLPARASTPPVAMDTSVAASHQVTSAPDSVAAELSASPPPRAPARPAPPKPSLSPRITRAMVTAIIAPSSEQGTDSMDTSKILESGAHNTTRKDGALNSEKSSLRGEESLSDRDAPIIKPTAESDDDADTTTSSRVTSSDCAVCIDVPSNADMVKQSIKLEASKDAGDVQVQIHVSPVRSDDRGDRDSIVSPVATATLNLAADLSPARRANQSLTRPSPRSESLAIPRGHSPAFASRRSLPHGLGQIDDATASDIVTDIAVRFSLPRQSHVGKPHLVHVPASAEPTMAKSDDMLHKEIFELPETISPRQSVYSIDPVPPLQVTKTIKDPATQLSVQASDLSSFIRRSFPRRQSVTVGDGAVKRASSESYHENRSSTTASGRGHLPRLKEESCEYIPNAATRISDFKFPLPRAATATGGAEPTITKIIIPPSQYPGMSLSELRNLPSLNFSRVNLVDQLNDALGRRSSKSMEAKRHHDVPEILCPSPMRPSSTEALRERYTSFFAKPDDFQVPLPTEETESFSVDILSEREQQSEGDGGDPKQSSSNASHAPRPSIPAAHRPLSPEELLGVVSDVNRLSVPSVAMLSDRLSELLPSLKRLHLNSAVADDEAVNNTIEEIHHLGERPMTMGSFRSSGGLRLMAAAADNIATHGTHDSAALDLKARLMKSLPPLPDETETSVTDSVLDKRPASCSDSVYDTTIPEMPKPARLRTKSESAVKSESRAMLSASNRTTAGSRLSLITSFPSSRPWNNDDNYPWFSDDLAFNIEYPQQAHCRGSVSSDQVRHAAKPSTISADINITSNDLSSTALSSVSDLDPTATVTADTVTGFGRKLSKRSLLGSFSRKIGLPNPGRPKNSLDVAGQTRRTHNAGDRYPSTALDPGLTFDMDEPAAFSNTSHHPDHTGNSTSLDNELRHSMVYERHGRSERSGSRPALRLGAGSSADTFNGTVGMGKMEFRVKRVTERLRHIWVKSHEVLRSLSQRGYRERKQRERREWLEDSLYSGT